ncbi:DUF4148 domain-containing protein [Paraburkholderia acidisoli]|uniref:DUF4148 domain-containing protein n=1 Tax=Paraburkholderia acidisoli TaxID=2571748 RepID=A0A7Z2GLU4_9BURK|nr:DUF4148 domain-containing protein [Paraburkholderia acidisoli]QGZ64187.1 DUF4148 domain-containing protein [Paraburkholderia acidisoli]
MNTRTLVQAAFVAALAAAPALSFAQAQDNNGPVTRAEVKSQLIQLEQAGYNPATANDSNYPSDIQAAEARVSQQQGQGLAQAQTPETSGYGSGTSGSSQSGQPASVRPSQSVYFGN